MKVEWTGLVISLVAGRLAHVNGRSLARSASEISNRPPCCASFSTATTTTHSNNSC